MAKLISETNVIPQSLYVTNVTFDVDHDPIGRVVLRRVLKGKFQEEAVALKILDKFKKGRKDVSPFFSFNRPKYLLFDGKLFQEFCKEALVWRSLTHRFILPLLGIFKEQKMQFLVSPLMPNGNLMEWRRTIRPLSLAEIHRLVRHQRRSEC